MEETAEQIASVQADALTLADGVHADGWSGAWVRNPDVADELRIGIDPWLGAVTLLPPSPRRRATRCRKAGQSRWPLAASQLHRRGVLGGLIHEYERAA